ncbi:unnamed protein product, partial [Mesorhabditis spiculigera]
MRSVLLLGYLYLLCGVTYASYECVTVYGQVVCEHDSALENNVKVTLYDSDSFLGMNIFGADTLMGTAYTNSDGHFGVYGCAADPDFLFITDRPDPYIVIEHHCNTLELETVRRDREQVFMPFPQRLPEAVMLASEATMALHRRKMKNMAPPPRAWFNVTAKATAHGRNHSRAIHVGDEVTLTCEVPRINREPLRWFKNGMLIRSETFPATVTQINSIVLKSVAEADNGNYECYHREAGKLAPVGRINITVLPAIQESEESRQLAEESILGFMDAVLDHPEQMRRKAPSPRVWHNITRYASRSTRNDTGRIQVGDDVTLSCEVPKNTGERLEWTKNGTLLDSGTLHGTLTVLNTIALINISKSDEVLYECFFVNGENKTLVGRENIAVFTPTAPEVINTLNQTHFLDYAQTGSLHCNLTDVDPENIIWKKDGERVSPRAHDPDQPQRLVFSKVGIDDAGEYVCSAEHRGVVKEAALTLKVVHSPVPMSRGWLIVAALVFFILLCVIGYLIVRCYVHSRQLSKMRLALWNQGEPWETLRNEPDASLDQQVDNLAFEAQRFDISPEELVLGREIGSGNFGIVRRGWLKRRNAKGDAKVTVAVKMARSQHDMVQQKMLRDELKIMGAIGAIGEHENVLRLVGAVTKHMGWGRLYLVLEYCERGSLRLYLKKIGMDSRSLPEAPRYESSSRVIRTIFRVPADRLEEASPLMDSHGHGSIAELYSFANQIARGMVFLSDVPCVHRDLAARNVLVTRDKICKIADFGLAKRMRNEYYKKAPNSGESMPWRWMSPEAIQTKRYTQASDVWSFGVLLYEIFSLGAQPYVGREVYLEDLQAGLQCSQPQYADDTLYSLMERCWNLEPTLRPKFKDCVESLQELSNRKPSATETSGECLAVHHQYQSLNPYEEVE